jgi:hypothetical protein
LSVTSVGAYSVAIAVVGVPSEHTSRHGQDRGSAESHAECEGKEVIGIKPDGPTENKAAHGAKDEQHVIDSEGGPPLSLTSRARRSVGPSCRPALHHHRD